MLQLVIHASDTRAFDSLVAPYVGRLRGYLYSLAKNESDADDLTQTALLKAWSELHRFDSRGRFIAWMFRIAHREFLQGLRSRRRYAKAMSGYGELSAADKHVSGDAPAAALDLSTLLATLEPDSRSALLLSRAVGLTHAEVALAMDKPLGTVKSLISRATTQLVQEHG